MRLSVRASRIIVAVWAVGVALGTIAMVRYEFEPGATPDAPDVWPAESTLDRTQDAFSLFVFAHPQCPCTRATLGELARIVAVCRNQVNVTVVFLDPETFPNEWVESDLWHQAARIPGVRVIRDAQGAETRRFGVTTSGHTLLYDGSGRLRFSGGITASRAHEGDNIGKHVTVTTVLNQYSSGSARTCYVFGCPILDG